MPVVVWALVAIGALAAIAIVTATIDRVLAAHHRHHAAALAYAEAGLAEALAAVSTTPALGSRPDSLAGAIGTGGYRVGWTPAAAGLAVRALGWSAGAQRSVEARVVQSAEGALRVVAWREVL